jgi:26S proteasome regulatory subunit N6
VEKGLVEEVLKLTKQILPLFLDFPKSKLAKVIRTLFDYALEIEGKPQELADLCHYIIEWCEREERSFLRMRIETNLADLLFQQSKFKESIELLNKLNTELKKKEDKQLLVESQLIESNVYHALENIPKSKAALTSVKTIVNSVYIVPKIQAKIDMMSGLIATDEKDYTTAYSYFYECFEGYRTMNELSDAGLAFKFMLFTKIMARQSEDSLALINSAISLKFQNRHVEAMKELALANKAQNLNMFQKCANAYEKEIYEDIVIQRHFKVLYNNLLEDNLRKIIEPYSEV